MIPNCRRRHERKSIPILDLPLPKPPPPARSGSRHIATGARAMGKMPRGTLPQIAAFDGSARIASTISPFGEVNLFDRYGNAEYLRLKREREVLLDHCEEPRALLGLVISVHERLFHKAL
jgi:hypothetical protein